MRMFRGATQYEGWRCTYPFGHLLVFSDYLKLKNREWIRIPKDKIVSIKRTGFLFPIYLEIRFAGSKRIHTASFGSFKIKSIIQLLVDLDYPVKT